jgi:hypothetical protein
MPLDQASFWATVQKVTTLSDGGIRLTLDLPEDSVYTAAWFMEMKRRGIVLDVKAVVRRGENGEPAERE